jgi:hypothetical protein
MTITALDVTATGLGLDFAERVSRHMETHFPDTIPAASWQVARDDRDNTAVVVAFPGSDRTLPSSCYAIHAYRWLCSLRDAGFIAEPRTDMEVFGRPDEEAPGGRARWLHVTGWDPKPPVPNRSISELAAELWKKLGLLPQHFVRLNPADHPPVDAVNRDSVRADLAVFTYQPDGKYGGMTVAVYEDTSGYPVGVGKVPAWLWEIGEAHRDHGMDGGWCYLSDNGLEGP